jgi:type VI secretion system secreted protein Hcp
MNWLNQALFHQNKRKEERIMFKNKRTAMVGTLVVALFLSLLTVMTPGKASAAYNCFLKVDGIPGESMDDKHKDWIEIVSWSFGETQPTTAASASAGGASAGGVKMQDFKFTMTTSKASPILFLAGANGRHIKEVTLEVCRSSQDKSKFLEIKLSEVIVSSFVSLGNSVSTQAYPMEEISLNFAKIQITYTMQKRPDGSGGGQVAAGWDVKANKAQ